MSISAFDHEDLLICLFVLSPFGKATMIVNRINCNNTAPSIDQQP